MDGRRNGLGLVAIGLGALALLVALIGQIGPRVSIQMDGNGYADQPQAQRGDAPAQAAPTALPRGADDARGEFRGGRFERDERFGDREHGAWGGPPWAGRGHMGGPPWAGRGGYDGHHMGGPGFFPFFILGGLLKFLAAMALILFGLRLFRGGRGGPGGRGGWGRRGRHGHYEPRPEDRGRPVVHTSETSYL